MHLAIPELCSSLFFLSFFVCAGKVSVFEVEGFLIKGCSPLPFLKVGPRSLKPQAEKNPNKARGGVEGRSSQVLFTKSGYRVEKLMRKEARLVVA